MSKPTALPVVELPPRSPHIQAPLTPYGSLPGLPELELEAPRVPVSHYLWILRRHLWMMIAFVASCVFITFIVSARLKPIYESTATIDVDVQAPSDVVGEDSTRSTTYRNPDQFLATQIRLIQSDSVLRPVAEEYHLLDAPGKNKNASAAQTQNQAEATVSLAT
jgi:uncharacterized protein involved in exopolysaccharide biosynthesis